GREVRIARAGGEDNNPFLFEVPDGASTDEWFSQLRYVDRRHHACVNVDFLEGILQDNGIHDSCQHANVVCGGAIHVARALRHAAEDVAATDDDRYLHAELMNSFQLFGNASGDVDVDAVVLLAHQRFA